MANRLDGKVAIATGGNSGIGEATAHLFAREGARVAIMARREEEGQRVQDAIAGEGGEATFIACDVSDVDSVESAVAEVAKTYGAIHVLFNNAGGGGGGKFPTESNEEWSRVISVNLTGTFYVSRAVWPHLMAAGGGTVVNMSSLAAQRGFSPRMFEEFGTASTSYYVAKAGVDALTRYMAGIGGEQQHQGQLRASRPNHDAGRDAGYYQRSRRRASRVREDVQHGADHRWSGLPGGRRESGPIPGVRRVAVYHRRDHQRRWRSRRKDMTLRTGPQRWAQ